MPQVSTGTNSHSWVSSSMTDGHIRYLQVKMRSPNRTKQRHEATKLISWQTTPMKIRENDTKHDLAKSFCGEKKIEMRVKLKQRFGGGIRKKKTPSVFGFQVTLRGMLLRAEWYPFTPLWKCHGFHHQTGQQCQRQHRVRISAVRHDFFFQVCLNPLKTLHGC